MGTCCKCDGFFTKWPDPQEPVYEDEEGAQYCLFHAPANEKRSIMNGPILSEQEFLRLVMKRIRDAHRAGATECDFREAIFPYMFSFSPFKSERLSMKIRFEGCEFFGDVLLNQMDSAEDILFSWAKFHCGATIWRSNFDGKIDFSGAKFLKGLRIGYSNFLNAVDLGNIECTGKPIEIINLSDNSLSNIIFDSTIVKKMLFCGINQWPQELGLQKHFTPPTSIKDLEELYRAMKQRAAEEHDQPQVSHWHYREKLMALKRGGNGIFEAVMLWLYWATSGFGERAVRAGVWLLALVVLSFVANSIKEPWVWAELPGSAAAQYTMATIPFAKDIPGDGWVKVGRGFWQFLIAVQFTLFALAVRNRFRR